MRLSMMCFLLPFLFLWLALTHIITKTATTLLLTLPRYRIHMRADPVSLLLTLNGTVPLGGSVPSP